MSPLPVYWLHGTADCIVNDPSKMTMGVSPPCAQLETPATANKLRTINVARPIQCLCIPNHLSSSARNEAYRGPANLVNWSRRSRMSGRAKYAV